MLDPKRWFVEIDEENHCAFAVEIKILLHREKTPYQTIEIYETSGFGRLLVIDGFIMLSSRDNFIYHEMLVHPVLFSHPRPEVVWIIGGGDCGSLREVLRHREVKRAVQIEIDERVTRLAEEYFPELCEANGDPRAEFHFQDGVRWVQEAEPESVDVIIIDSTDPLGPGEGLFTEAFYRDCLKCLRPGGMVVQQSESPLFHPHILHGMRRAMRRAGFREVHTLFFPQPVYPSGWWSATVGCRDRLGEPRVAELPFPTRYYNLQIHRAAFAMPNFFKEEVKEKGGL